MSDSQDDSWRDQAACRGMDPAVFYPSRKDSLEPALAICESCPVRAECLDDGLNRVESGVWGGTSERERKRMRRRRMRAA